MAGTTTAFALADPARLEQALSHLVLNAIDASPRDEPVTLSLVYGDGECGIEVVDRGSGMTPEVMSSILFKPFASTKSGGFGVGAFEARSLIAAMGGRLSVDSRPGKGSRFTIHLPESQKLAEPKRKRA